MLTTDPALADALAVIGDRWALLVIDALVPGPQRFGDLATAIPGIAPNILTARLRLLGRHGLVSATPYSHRPVRLSYDLTATGRELAGPLTMLSVWAAARVGAAGPRHDACGTPLEARLWCPTCETAHPLDDVGTHHV
jgi:DNA-binding HxlR family transcriptional regulator